MTTRTPAGGLPGAPLLPFLLITYGIAWGLFALFAGRLGQWRVGPLWWAFVVVGIPLIFVIGAAMKGSLATCTMPFGTVGETLTGMGFMLLLGPIEEFGWRGVALPLLQRRLAPLWASVVLGLIWGLWHMPAFLMSGTPQSAWDFSPFVVGAIAISVILTPLFNASGGSILLAMLFHFQLSNPLWPDAQPYDSAMFGAVAVVVTLMNRKAVFSRDSAVQRVIPEPRP